MTRVNEDVPGVASKPMRLLYSLLEDADNEFSTSGRRRADYLRRAANRIILEEYPPAYEMTVVTDLMERVADLEGATYGTMASKMGVTSDGAEDGKGVDPVNIRGSSSVDSAKNALCRLANIERKILNALKGKEFKDALESAKLAPKLDDDNELADDLELFLNDRCQVAPGFRTSNVIIYEAYRRWCVETGRQHVSKVSFGMWMHGASFTSARTANERFWLNVTLKNK